MDIQVQYFAAARELSGCSEETLSVPDGSTAGGAFEAVCAHRPALAGFAQRMALALNDEMCSPDVPVRDGDRLAILPPVAGGAPRRCSVQDTPLSVDAALACVTHPGAGGINVFIGIVRDHADGQDVSRLDYEAHEAMAEKEMARVLDDVEKEMPGVRLCAQHRTGQLAIGDAAVVIAASAPHRAEAFAACRAAIDRIKERVPIWKKEWGPAGEAHWVNLAPPEPRDT